MTRIIIYTAGTLGDHLPYLALARRLVERGHSVRMALNASMCRFAEQAGIETVPLPDLEGGEEEVKSYAWAWNHWEKHPAPTLTEAQIKQKQAMMVEQCRQLAILCRQSDLLVATSIRPMGYVAANMTGIPWITVSMNPSMFFPPKDEDGLRMLHRVQQAEYNKMLPTVDWLIRELGGTYDRPPFSTSWIWSSLVLLASSPWFSRPQMDQLQPHSDLIQTGFWYYEDPRWADWQPDEELRRFCEPADPLDKPMVLSFSSQPLEHPEDILFNHVQAANLLGKKLLVQRGWADFNADMLPAEMDRSRVLFRDFLPHDWIFSRVVCAIQHGGMGSIARAIRRSCPLLVEPFGNDQFYNANRVQELGVGVGMDPFHLDPQEIAARLTDYVLHPSTRAQVDAVGAKLRAENGEENACRIIEKFIARQVESQTTWQVPPIYGLPDGANL